MKSALFRADGSQHLGSGHIMRCLAFAQGLEKLGAKSIFVTRDYEPKVAEIIRRYRCGVEPIPQSCSFKEDLRLTSQLANQHNAKLIMTDLCNTDILANLGEYSEYLQGLKDTGKFLITIDDLNEMPFPSDIVINPNYGAEDMNYDLNGCTKYLLGPAYFIFKQEFVEAAKINRETRKVTTNILVTMGGNDLLNLTVKVANSLSKIKLEQLNFKIIVGVAYSKSKKEQLEASLKQFHCNYELILSVDNISELMLWADLAITAGGLTRYETAVTGTPSITISQHRYEDKLMQKFSEAGTTEYLGYGEQVAEEDILLAFKNLLRDESRRADMSRKGRKLVDGRGIDRILNLLTAEPGGVL